MKIVTEVQIDAENRDAALKAAADDFIAELMRSGLSLEESVTIVKQGIALVDQQRKGDVKRRREAMADVKRD